MDILFVQTGGTIDKDYPRTVKGYAFEISEPAVKKILDNIQPNFDYKIVTLLKKDSSDITDTERNEIFNYCRKSTSERIIITHGTDTLIKTALLLKSIKNKTIILTGAFKPETFKNSDADFNIGFAIGALENALQGVYVAMNGKLFSAGNVSRNAKGQFIEKKKR